MRAWARKRWGWSFLFMLVLVGAFAPGEALASQPDSYAGKLEVLHGDDFKTGKTKTSYYLRTARDGRLRLEGLGRKALRHAGDRLTVSGVRRGRKVRVGSARYQRSRSAKASAVGGERDVAVFMLNFQNDSSEPYDAATVRDSIFTGPRSVNAFYQEETSGQLSLKGRLNPDGDVFGWYTVPYDNTTCNPSAWATAALSAAESQGVDTSGYDNYMFTFGQVPIGVCWFAGLAQVDGNWLWLNEWVTSHAESATPEHELGHNLGLWHASSLDCGSSRQTPIGINDHGSCTIGEYGDPWDVMGLSGYQNHGANKGRLAYSTGISGFLEGNTRTVTTEGTYAIAPSEPGFSGDQVLRIPTRPNPQSYEYPYYYIDFRQPYGVFDSFPPNSSVATGVGIRLAADYGASPQPTLLVDATPGDHAFNNAMLGVDRSFVDPDAGFAIRTLSTGPSGAQVQYERLAGKVVATDTQIVYEARPGQANDVTITQSNGLYTVTDRGAPSIEASLGCNSTGDPQVVTCADAGINAATISLGDGNDRFSGGPENDLVDGGAGADTINGGAGSDGADYSSRSKPVRADLDGASADDGETNERDSLGADLEDIVGGIANDTLTGNSLANNLNGAGGDDSVFGAGGDDTLTGGTGRNTVDGDAGNDLLNSLVTGIDVLKGDVGNDVIEAKDGDFRDRADCGSGSDTARVDYGDSFASKPACETIL